MRKYEPPDSPKCLREATFEDVQKYKRGNKNINPIDYLLCQCWCGNYYVPSKKNFKKNLSRSCGQHSNLYRVIDETGHQYGELTVLSRAKSPDKDNHHQFWKCQCSCGNIIVRMGKELRDGSIRSCGCVRSKGEKRINQILTKLKISFEKEFRFSDLINKNGNAYRFDWAIFNNDGKVSCLIEYDGEQHFDSKNKWYRFDNSDEIKTQYCKDHNIKLIRIPYYDYDKINDKYLEDLIYE